MPNREIVQNKEDLERAHATAMSKAKVKQIEEEAQKEAKTKVAVAEAESIVFEDDEEIRLRDGKTYKIHPCTLGDARKVIKLMNSVNAEYIIYNLLSEAGTSEADLFDLLLIAFKAYPHVNKEYLENYVDLDVARDIIDILIGLNGLKK